MNGAGGVAKSSLSNVGGRWLPQLGLAVLLVGLATGLFGASTASAFDKYVDAGDVPGTELSAPTKAAVDDATGNLLVVDAGNSKVQVWSPGGTASTHLADFGAGELSSPYGIAIDQSNGDVYISDAGNNRIVRYTTDGAEPPTYTLDAGYAGPAPGSDATIGQIGNFASPLAIDPATRDLLVADTGNQYVSRFDADGSFVSSFDGATSQGGPFVGLLDVVVGGGVTYVLDATGPYDPTGPLMTGISRVEQFDGAGDSLGALPNDYGMDKARDLAYGTASDSLFVAQQGIGGPFPSVLHVYRNGTEYQTVKYAGVDYSSAAGLAVDNGSPTASGRVYGILAPTPQGVVNGIHVFDRQQLPDVTADPPSNIATTSAHLTGTADPIVGTATAQFEISADNGVNWTPVTTTNDTATAPAVGHPEADLTALTPFSTYQVRLTASNAYGSNTSAAQTFRTIASPPAVSGEQATDRGPTSATLRAKVTPFGLATTFHFEYGLTTAYGARVPTTSERAAGSGQAPLLVAQIVEGLQPATTYHFRVVAHNAAGDTVSADQTFTTTVTPPPGSGRAYELVSPANKGGANVKSQLGMQSSLDGTVLAYVGSTAFGGFPDGGTTYPRYVAHRGAGGWSNRATDPPQAKILQDVGPIHTTVGISEDGTKAVVLSARKLAPGAVEDAGNVYLLDVATGAYTTMATTPNVTWFEQEAYLRTTLFVQGTPNFDHVLLLAPDTSFLPGVPDGALYEFANGQLEVVSRDPANAVIQGSGVGNKDHERNVISTDGSRVIFSSTDAVYIREGGTTRAMSVSERSADPPGTLRPAALIGADRKLDHVYFLAEDLTDASVPNRASLYRYDTNADPSGALTLLGVVSDVPGGGGVNYLQVSADGSSVYFASQAALTPDAPSTGVLKVYVWRNGGMEYIAELAEPTLEYWWASPNGRYLAFASGANITGYDATNPQCSNSRLGEVGACRQIYRYDADTKSILCASCPVDGRQPTASAYIGETFADVGTHAFPRAVNNDGHVFFGSKEQLVEKDVNSVEDVYEFDGEQQHLISTGTGGPALLGEVSEDGRDVFFTTQDRLVAADTDNSTDVYDARVGGGIASQTEPRPSTDCSGEDCSGTAAVAPPMPLGGSEGTHGRGNSSAHHKKRRCGKGRHVRKVKGKQRCVKQHKANNNRRQGR
ncbi:MAG TPA: hypothetical protein VLK37_07590 [Solirubrobacterales bacterium]|nr:hypothetical protein [Solirubrobacterales bacterium]